MNVKHELFTQALLKHGGNQTKAYLEVYPGTKYTSSRANASRLVSIVSVRKRITELMESRGMGLVESINKLKDLTEAKKLYRYATFSGEVSDNSIRLEAIKIALRINGLLGHKSDIISLYLSPEQLEQLEKLQEPLIEEE